jgi:hypothetical protein
LGVDETTTISSLCIKEFLIKLNLMSRNVMWALTHKKPMKAVSLYTKPLIVASWNLNCSAIFYALQNNLIKIFHVVASFMCTLCEVELHTKTVNNKKLLSWHKKNKGFVVHDEVYRYSLHSSKIFPVFNIVQRKSILND